MGDYNGTESFDEFYMEIWPEGDESKIKGFRFEATPENMNKRYISFRL